MGLSVYGSLRLRRSAVAPSLLRGGGLYINPHHLPLNQETASTVIASLYGGDITLEMDEI